MDGQDQIKYEGDSLRTLNHIVRECDQTQNCRIFPLFLFIPISIKRKKSSFKTIPPLPTHLYYTIHIQFLTAYLPTSAFCFKKHPRIFCLLNNCVRVAKITSLSKISESKTCHGHSQNLCPKQHYPRSSRYTLIVPFVKMNFRLRIRAWFEKNKVLVMIT